MNTETTTDRPEPLTAEEEDRVRTDAANMVDGAPWSNRTMRRTLATLDAARAHTGSERDAGLDEIERTAKQIVDQAGVHWFLAGDVRRILRSAAPTGANPDEPSTVEVLGMDDES